MGIVGVHGIRQFKFHRDPSELEAIWFDAIRRSCEFDSSDFHLAYYAPILHLGTRQGSDSADEFNDIESRVITSWLAAHGAPMPTAQGPATRRLRDGLDWFAQTKGGKSITPAVVASAFREVGVYVDPEHKLRRHKARLAVATAIAHQRPRVLIAHSLGSVVAYESLWTWPSLPIELFLTLGSPLALPGVFAERLDPVGAGQLRKPPGVMRWVNVADEGDLIAVPKRLSLYFRGIDEDLTVSLGTVAFHGIEAYLKCPEVAAILAPYVEGQV